MRKSLMLDSTGYRPSWLRQYGGAFLRWWIAAMVRRKWLVIGVALLLTALAGYASTTLTVSTNTEDILSQDLQFIQTENRYHEVFPRQERIVVVVDANTPGTARSAAISLAEKLRRHPGVFESVEVPGTAYYFRRNALLFLEEDRLHTLANQLVRSQPALLDFARDPNLRGVAGFLDLVEAGVRRGRTPPELARTLLSLAETTAASAKGKSPEMSWNALFDPGAGSNRKRALVLLDPVAGEAKLSGNQPALSQVRAGISEATEVRPGLTMRVTGLLALRQQELNDVFSGALYATSLSFVLVTLSLCLMRSWRMVFALVVTLVAGSIMTTGLAAATVGHLNLISITFLVLFIGLGVDFGTHFGLRYLEEAKDKSFADATAKAAAGEAPGITLSALCASAGFLSFLPTAYTGLGEFGIISTLGMVVAVVITFTLLPALMAVLPPKPRAEDGITIGLGDWIKRHHRAILAAALAVTVAAAFVAPRIEMNVNPLDLQNPELEAVQAYRDLAGDPETSPYALNAVAQNLDAARDLARRLSSVDSVAEVRTIESFIPNNQAAKLEALREAARDLTPVLRAEAHPATLSAAELQQAFSSLRRTASDIASADTSSAAEAAARLSAALDRFATLRGTEASDLRQLDQALTGTLPGLIRNLKTALSVSEPVSIADVPPDLRRDWITPDGRVRVQILPKPNAVSSESLAEFARDVQTAAPEAVGVPVQITEAGDAVARAFVQAIGYTAFAVVIIIMAVRRSLFDVALVLAPLAIAALWTVAGAVVAGLSFNFANVIVIPLLIGLGIASNIHMVVRFRESASAGRYGSGAAFLSTSTPLAVFVAQINTAAAFATLAVANHRGLFSMGVLLGLAIFCVLVVSLLVLPAALIRWQRFWQQAAVREKPRRMNLTRGSGQP